MWGDADAGDLASLDAVRQSIAEEHAMSAAPMPIETDPRAERSAAARVDARLLWTGLAIIFMWLAVLFVGLFGGDIRSYSAGGTGSTVPAAVAVAVFALVGTIFVARSGFGGEADTRLRAALDDERRARERLADEVAELRADVTRRCSPPVTAQDPADHTNKHEK
jgi:hypothetical protein